MAFLKFLALFALIAVATAKPTFFPTSGKGCGDGLSGVNGAGDQVSGLGGPAGALPGQGQTVIDNGVQQGAGAGGAGGVGAALALGLGAAGGATSFGH